MKLNGRGAIAVWKDFLFKTFFSRCAHANIFKTINAVNHVEQMLRTPSFDPQHIKSSKLRWVEYDDFDCVISVGQFNHISVRLDCVRSLKWSLLILLSTRFSFAFLFFIFVRPFFSFVFLTFTARISIWIRSMWRRETSKIKRTCDVSQKTNNWD